MTLYRVFPWLTGARRRERGHALHVAPIQGAGRVDDPEHYRVLYASDSPAGAVAEAFGNHGVWTDQLFAGRPELPGSQTALAELEVARLQVLDLDDGRALLDREMRPSEVVTRDRSVTQTWALRVFRENCWAGVRWWSYYDSRWGSYGLWELKRFQTSKVTRLARDHPAVLAAAATLARPFRS